MKPCREQPSNGLVCIMGAIPDTGNRGVSALCNSVVKNVLAVRTGTRIAVFTGNRSADAQEIELAGRRVQLDILNFRLSSRSKLRDHLALMLLLAGLHRIVPTESLKCRLVDGHRVLRELKRASLIGDIRGGDSFSDIYGLRSFLIGCLPYFVVLWLGKDLVFLPQTFGPFRSRVAYGVARYFLRKASKVYCRDHHSVELARKLRGTGAALDGVAFCPDVAFTLDAIQPDAIEAVPEINLKAARPLLGLNVSGLLYEESTLRRNAFGLRFSYRAFITELISQLMAKTSAHVLLIPHTFGVGDGAGGDLNACRDVIHELRSGASARLALVDREYDASRLKWIIGQCDFFVGSRMHACIAAVSQGVPVAPVAYSDKFIGVFNSVGLGDLVIDPRNVSQQEAIDRVVAAYQFRAELRARILPLMQGAQARVRETFLELVPRLPAPHRAEEISQGI
jgi:polysaccharide pyruvyl transferase WcaK-like protein